MGKIKFLTSQHEIEINPEAKTITMDVYLRDEKKIINVELQNGHRLELPRRSRFYQAAADSDLARTIDNKIAGIKENIEVRGKYMTYTTRIAEAKTEAFEEGIAIGEERGRNEGISLGITQGAYQKAVETAKSMKSENMSIDMIAHFTGLSVEEIEKL